MKSLVITYDTKPGNGHDVQILHLEGIVDRHTIHDLQQELAQQVSGGHYNLLLDCEKLSYMNSPALGLLMTTCRQVRDYEGDLLVAKMNPKMKSIFHVLGFNHVIREYDDYEQGLLTEQ